MAVRRENCAIAVKWPKWVVLNLMYPCIKLISQKFCCCYHLAKSHAINIKIFDDVGKSTPHPHTISWKGLGSLSDASTAENESNASSTQADTSPNG